MSSKWEGGDYPAEQAEAPVELPPPENFEAATAEAWTADIPPPAKAATVTDASPAETPPAVPEEPETAEPPVEYGSVREALLSNAENEKLLSHSDRLYRETATEGDGGTAAALFQEKETGELVGGQSHSMKSEQHSRGLGKLVEGGSLNATDREIAKDLKEDLDNAIAYDPAGGRSSASPAE